MNNKMPSPIHPALSEVMRPHYHTLQGYVSAGMEVQKSAEKLFLNANENPYELPGLEGFNRYPEPQPPALAEAFARAYGVEASQLVMTRGADEAIVILTKLFCAPEKDAVLICPPTFGMYGVNARSAPARVVEMPLKKRDGSFFLDVKGIVDAVQSAELSIKMIYICSPNNPTATSFSHEVISEICEAVEGKAVVILDETYAEFSAQGSMVGDLDSTPNLIILRTLSKSYAFAGMRMGAFLCGDEAFIALCKAKCLDAYPLPLASIEAAFHVLSPEISAIAHENIKTLLKERDRLKAKLEASPHVEHVYPSDANFLLVKMKDAKGFHAACMAEDIILRDFSGKAGTEGCLRISVGTPEQNDRVLEILKDF